ARHGGHRHLVRGRGHRRNGQHSRRARRLPDRWTGACARRPQVPRVRALRHLRRNGTRPHIPQGRPVRAAQAQEDLTLRDRTMGWLALAAAGLIAAGFFLPGWLLNQMVFAFGRGLAVLGLVVLWRAGLVSLGGALYFGL